MDIKSKFRNVLMLFALSCCWGPSFLFIKLAIVELPPSTLVFSRLLIGVAILYTVLIFKGERLSEYAHHWKHFVVMGFFSTALPFSLISLGEKTIPSSLAAIINSTTPIFTALLAHNFIASERLSASRIIGVLLGFIGISVVFSPALRGEFQHHIFGSMMVLVAASSYAVAMVYGRRNTSEIPSLVGATGQLMAASFMLLPLSLFYDKAYTFPVPSLQAMAGVLGLGIFGTAIAFVLYFQIMKSAGASFLSTATLLFPVIGIILGVVFLDEEVRANAYIGCALILAGLAIANQLLPTRLYLALGQVAIRARGLLPGSGQT